MLKLNFQSKQYSSLAHNLAVGDRITFTNQPLNLKPMNHETKATLKAAITTGYILLVAMFCIAYFGRFIFALIFDLLQ